MREWGMIRLKVRDGMIYYAFTNSHGAATLLKNLGFEEGRFYNGCLSDFWDNVNCILHQRDFVVNVSLKNGIYRCKVARKETA
jgi:hypothetical protein